LIFDQYFSTSTCIISKDDLQEYKCAFYNVKFKEYFFRNEKNVNDMDVLSLLKSAKEKHTNRLLLELMKDSNVDVVNSCYYTDEYN